LSERREQGPKVETPGHDVTVAPVKPRMTDKDYSREETPRVDSSLPVDRHRWITADNIINAVLVTPINSQIPGIVRAVVDSNVYGSDGRLILIPKGSVALGKYESLSKQGDSRLNVQWFRILRPDGAQIWNDEDPYFIGQDLAGRTGLIGTVDNRIWERYGAAFITSLISAAASTTVALSDSQGLNNAGNNLSQSLAQVTAKVLDQNLNLAPIITIDAGSLITIALTKDVYMRDPIYPNDEDEKQENAK